MAVEDGLARQPRESPALLLAMAAISIGMAAFIAITAFDANVRDAVQHQAKSLLGADLVLSSRQPLTPETEALLAELGGEQSREISCTSMAYFPKSAASRLVQVRALEEDFPYYGALETVPALAAYTFRAGLQAVVDDGLLLQFDAQVGDAIKIGTLTLPIAGRLKKIPGEAVAAALIKPRVYMPIAALQQTELLHKGSIVTYKVYVKLPPEVDADALLETLRPHLTAYRLTGETARQRAASVGRLMTNLSRFLHLVGFIAVLLGGVGVASAIQVYITDKRDTVAILRCLGARAPQALAVYVLQAAVLGAIGAMVGGAGGLAVQAYLPRLLHDFLPVTMPLTIAWPALLRGLGTGVGMVLLFALLPLLSVRRVTPLLALRALQCASTRRTRPLALGLCCSCSSAVSAPSRSSTPSAGHTVRASALRSAWRLDCSRWWRSSSCGSSERFTCTWPYVWRQGLANLYRPQNQTLMLVLALGFGTFLLTTLYLTQQTLLRHVALTDAAGQPNLILFDIQSDQRHDVTTLVHSYGLSVLQQVPFVTMRLMSIKGRSTVELRAEKHIPEWALLWEYRATYREHLLDTETLSAGTWHSRVLHPDAAVPVSLEEEIARTLNVGLGDALVLMCRACQSPRRWQPAPGRLAARAAECVCVVSCRGAGAGTTISRPGDAHALA